MISSLFPDLKPSRCCILFFASAFQAFGLYHVHSLADVTEGGIFGLTMTLGLLGLAALILLCFGADTSMVWSIPWWLVLLFCWVGYGGTMGIITMLAKRR